MCCGAVRSILLLVIVARCLLLTFWLISFNVVEESVLLDCCLVDFHVVISRAATWLHTTLNRYKCFNSNHSMVRNKSG